LIDYFMTLGVTSLNPFPLLGTGSLGGKLESFKKLQLRFFNKRRFCNGGAVGFEVVWDG
jgi:hypothetical protein